MFYNKYIHLFILSHFFFSVMLSQTTDTLVVKKDKTSIYFFQQGKKTDTLDRDNRFYLLVSDSLKKGLLIQLENAQIRSIMEDSLVTLVNVRGINYEAWYLNEEDFNNTRRRKLVLKSFVNGTNTMQGNKISIRFISRKEGNVLLENSFFFKN